MKSRPEPRYPDTESRTPSQLIASSRVGYMSCRKPDVEAAGYELLAEIARPICGIPVVDYTYVTSRGLRFYRCWRPGSRRERWTVLQNQQSARLPIESQTE